MVPFVKQDALFSILLCTLFILKRLDEFNILLLHGISMNILKSVETANLFCLYNICIIQYTPVKLSISWCAISRRYDNKHIIAIHIIIKIKGFYAAAVWRQFWSFWRLQLGLFIYNIGVCNRKITFSG